MSIKAEMTGQEAVAQLTGMMRFFTAAGDPNVNRVPLEAFAEYMQTRTDLLFATGSRDGVRWKRLAASTLANRRARGVSGARILQVTGGLRRSIRADVVQSLDGLTARIHSEHPRARIHHRGAHVPARTVFPRRARALKFTVGKKTVFARRAEIPAFDIPSRPILFISDRDNATGVRYIREYRLKLFRRAMKQNRSGSAAVGEVLT